MLGFECKWFSGLDRLLVCGLKWWLAPKANRVGLLLWNDMIFELIKWLDWVDSLWSSSPIRLFISPFLYCFFIHFKAKMCMIKFRWLGMGFTRVCCLTTEIFQSFVYDHYQFVCIVGNSNSIKVPPLSSFFFFILVIYQEKFEELIPLSLLLEGNLFKSFMCSFMVPNL